MKKDWREMIKWSDDELLMGLVAERMSELNPYSPFHRRLDKVYDRLQEKVKAEREVMVEKK